MPLYHVVSLASCCSVAFLSPFIRRLLIVNLKRDVNHAIIVINLRVSETTTGIDHSGFALNNW